MKTTPTPLQSSEVHLFVGIDVAKKSHMAGFITPELLLQEKKFSRCPTRTIDHSREGINAFRRFVEQFGATPATTAVLMEQTGHYHKSLLEQLLAEGFHCYVVAIHQKKINGQAKTDKYDALRLANMLYAQVALGMQVDHSGQRIEQRLPPIPAAASLAPLVRMHYEATQQMTRLRNKLTAIQDELFPEFTRVFHDPNLVVALRYRSHFPTPSDIVRASLEQLKEFQWKNYPTDEHLQLLQELAGKTIGTKDEHRLHGLLLEQTQLIELLTLLREQMDRIDAEIKQIVLECREGQILLSLPAMGFYDAATLLAVIGNIRNFDSAAALRRFAGWAPQSFQTGTTIDQDNQTRAGNRLFKQSMYMLTLRAIQAEPWKSFYDRLVLKRCSYDSRLKKYLGKNRVVGRVAGSIISLIFAFLKSDADLVDATAEGELPPEPRLYDLAVHLSHRSGTRIHPSSQTA